MSKSKTLVRVADYIVDRLVQAGICDVFLVTGGGAMHLNDAFSRNGKIDITCFHHEQAASIAAEGYARVNQNPCCLNVTSGPGGINAMVGVYGAYVDSIPLFVISGQVKNETIAANYPSIPLRQLGDQEVDIVSMVRPIVKYVKAIKSPFEVCEAMTKAIFLMKNGRPGPVWLDIPIDVQSHMLPKHSFASNQSISIDYQKIDVDESITPNTVVEIKSNCADNSLKNELFQYSIDKLKLAKKPVILVGTGTSSDLSRKLFGNLINELDIPVVTGWNALDMIPSNHKNLCGRPGTVGDRSGNIAVQNSDFVLIIGCRLNIRQISYNWKSFAKNAYKVMVDIDQTEMDKPTLEIDLKIRALSEEYLKFLNENLKGYKNKDHLHYLKWCRVKVNSYPVVLEEYKSKVKLNPYFFLEELSRIIPPNSIVVTGNGAACVMTFQAFKVKENQRIFTNSGCAAMGYDLPSAIGASIATKKEKIIYCIAGDGSIMMNLQELQTIKGLNLPINILILNNGGYLSIRSTQQAYFPDNVFGTGPENGVSIPNFMKLSEGFQIPYFAVKTIKDLDSNEFLAGINSMSPFIVEVFVDPLQGFSPKLASRKNDDGTMTSPDLDDMAPFLSFEEMELNRIQ